MNKDIRICTGSMIKDLNGEIITLVDQTPVEVMEVLNATTSDDFSEFTHDGVSVFIRSSAPGSVVAIFGSPR